MEDPNPNDNVILLCDCVVYHLKEGKKASITELNATRKYNWKAAENEKSSPLYIIYNSERNIYRFFSPCLEVIVSSSKFERKPHIDLY